MKKALISGVCGQDGSYLAELLLEKGYEVYGIYRRSSSPNFWRISHIKNKLNLFEGDVTDMSSLLHILQKVEPDEIYNLAAQSHVGSSFNQSLYTTNVDYIGCLNFLELIRQLKLKTKFYQAGTSEQFGGSVNSEGYQNEATPFNPQSPYAVAKLAAFYATRLYRQSYHMFACTGILFNHESPRRGEEFVTRKISKYVQRLHALKFTNYPFYDGPKLKLGNLTASRDWGYAKDYVEGMWLMLQQKYPKDYVLATGETHTVGEFLDEAFGLIKEDWRKFVDIDLDLIRPSEVDYLKGDASKAKNELGWEVKTKFKELVKIMVGE